jgi:hypothetical protein
MFVLEQGKRILSGMFMMYDMFMMELVVMQYFLVCRTYISYPSDLKRAT